MITPQVSLFRTSPDFSRIFAMALVALLAFLSGRWSVDKVAQGKPAPQAVIVASLDHIEESIVSLASARCLNITTPSVNWTVYETPNLGVHKVPKPPAPKKQVSVASKEPDPPAELEADKVAAP